MLHSDDYSHTVIDDFEVKPLPVIAVSVDMMDTGVDVPEIVNLVFFKKVRSKIKFWQMIGRGTRLREGLEVVDPLNGPHVDKERFFIFDWCKNFEFFREHLNVSEGKIALSLTEQVFQRQAELAMLMQESAFAADGYQSLRQELVDAMRGQVVALNDELFSVRRHRREVEKYRRVESFRLLTPTSFAELKSPISMLVVNDEADVDALRFDALMYGYMIAACQGGKTAGYKSRLISIAACLQKVTTIPQVKDKLPLIDEVFDADSRRCKSSGYGGHPQGAAWLIRFIVAGRSRRDVITHLDDPVTRVVYGVEADIGEDFEDYKLKVERYLKDYADTLVIHKLRSNQPMTEFEFEQLERIFTHDLGNAEDYAKAYGDTPFGLLVRRLVHLDHDRCHGCFCELPERPEPQ